MFNINNTEKLLFVILKVKHANKKEPTCSMERFLLLIRESGKLYGTCKLLSKKFHSKFLLPPATNDFPMNKASTCRSNKGAVASIGLDEEEAIGNGGETSPLSPFIMDCLSQTHVC